MRLTIATVVCVALYFLGETWGEACVGTDASTCVTTSCVTGLNPICVNNTCTCAELCREQDNLGGCRTQSNCIDAHNANRLNCTCFSADLHCIDRECHCVHLSFP